jgi:hypothetical protein
MQQERSISTIVSLLSELKKNQNEFSFPCVSGFNRSLPPAAQHPGDSGCIKWNCCGTIGE